MTHQPSILFTAFEPSGDEHAAPVIAALKRHDPSLRICAMGGPRMEAAGAEMIERTTDRSVMGAGAVGQTLAHRARLKRLRGWIEMNPVRLHVPTDSPAANWAICRMVKNRWGGSNAAHDAFGGKPGGRVAHLVAPQVWAWASWRVRRLRRWSDHVLCLLPFEPDWFATHGVAATFIGHPVYDQLLETQPLGELAPAGAKRLALLPGSRRGEVAKNWPIMKNVVAELSQRFVGELATVVAAADEQTERMVQQSPPDAAANTPIVRGRMADVLAWADAALVVSGTATLHVTRQRKPMVVVYGASRLTWHAVGRWLMNTRTFSLPNLVAGGGPHRDRSRHIVPEFVPFLRPADDVAPITDAVAALLEDPAEREKQIADLAAVARAFEGHNAGEEAAAVIRDLLE